MLMRGCLGPRAKLASHRSAINPLWWAGPARQRQLLRMREGRHPTLDLPLGVPLTNLAKTTGSEQQGNHVQHARVKAWLNMNATKKGNEREAKQDVQESNAWRFLFRRRVAP